jgi:hypothetical protein
MSTTNENKPYVGQIRISDSGRNYTKITKLTPKMLYYLQCDKHGSPLNDKAYRILIKHADLYLGDPIETY